jgi:hypothetical protein
MATLKIDCTTHLTLHNKKIFSYDDAVSGDPIANIRGKGINVFKYLSRSLCWNFRTIYGG